MEISYFESLTTAKKAYDQLLQPVCRKWGMTRNALDTLLFLGNNPGKDRAADVVKHRGIAKSHVSAAVAELEEGGFLQRQTDALDRRNARLVLTASGETVAEAGRQVQKMFFETIFAGLTQEDFARWQHIMDTVTDNIDSLKRGL